MSRTKLYLLVCLVLLSCAAVVVAQRRGGPGAEAFDYRPVTVVADLEFPWSFAFLPDGRMLVTERPGRLRIVGLDGQLSAPVTGVPAVWAQGQGGLLDVALDPAFASNGYLYLSYAEPGERDEAGTAVARGKLVGNQLEQVEVIWRQLPKVRSGAHFGSRLVFSRDGKLFVTLGDRGILRDQAQDLAAPYGKTLRLNPDGSVPADNPYVGVAGALPEIWSHGHRNMQGAALHPETGKLWTHEHGAMGGDEINVDEAGRNYGWPVITWGVNYDGQPIGIGSEKAGMEQPLLYWKPSIAPSGMAFYSGDRYPGWHGSLLVGSLKFRYLNRIELDGTRIKSQQRLLTDLGERIRCVRQGPDGLIYVSTDSADGRVIRLDPLKPGPAGVAAPAGPAPGAAPGSGR